MLESLLKPQRALRRLRLVIGIVGLIVAALGFSSRAQDASPPVQRFEPGQVAKPKSTDQIPHATRTDAGSQEPRSNSTIAERLVPQLMTVWDLTVRGGIFMIPIGICSIVVLAFAIERMVALRAKKIMPPRLLLALQKLSNSSSGIDPRQAYAICQSHPSPLANVLRTAILKIGRPYSELEKAVEDSVGREADVMNHNIRPINVSASIGPLLGLLGTVQGMIMAFMVTSTTTATGAAKGQELAQGIYTALVTTFAGLCVAIPAILIAHMLEGRIERLLRDMEDVFLDLVPQFERFEGKLRATRTTGASDKAETQHEAAAKVAAPMSGKAGTPSRSRSATAASSMAEHEVVQSTSKGLWGVMGAQRPTSEES